jgi:hypothetical protein
MKPFRFFITSLFLSTISISNFYAQEWTISPFNLKRDSGDQKKLWTINPVHNSYLSSQLFVTGFHTHKPTRTLVVRDKSNSLEGYATSVIIGTVGLIELVVKDDYLTCYVLLTQTLESLKMRGASEARLFFKLDDDQKLKEKYGYEALRMLGFVSELYTEDTQCIVLRKKSLGTFLISRGFV